ncbi:hypothetical protein PPTG_00243 [Phytophthora nicotianae INRA-310]|uniref:Peptidase A2 domain-containing protein n=1 Tax=Phytophthora nicotianae (strain INRA-310) TaxID=761204 RepID=W2REN7_PHYN3|nr:hypothetical protein PPTG_00243 [Phytophthora nicotianae INRA-310]ETN23706.1 hypothetical protein PPTG_00243 [Phytophthora nicotianae INRA-310]
MHWLSECPTASDDQKAEIRPRMKRLRECIPSQEKTVLLNEELAVPYCADTGADRTAISKQHVTQLLRSDTSTKVTPLDTPTVHVAVGDHEVISTHFVRLRLRLNTAAGPVGLQEPVDCLIIECDEPEFILGRDEGEDEGEEDLQDDLPSISLSSTDKDLQDALERIISSALDQGFPSHLEQQLRAIVFKHDIWRLELGNDPPANVEALRIRLKDGARAVKSKPRPYPPAPLG